MLGQLLGREGSQEALNAAFGWTSAPFPYLESATVAVRVITSLGGTMSWSGDPKKAMKVKKQFFEVSVGSSAISEVMAVEFHETSALKGARSVSKVFVT